jgi:hypothetical protein
VLDNPENRVLEPELPSDAIEQQQHQHDEPDVSTSVNPTSATEARIETVRSLSTSTRTAGGISERNGGSPAMLPNWRSSGAVIEAAITSGPASAS